jgi:hypothetical protein
VRPDIRPLLHLPDIRPDPPEIRPLAYRTRPRQPQLARYPARCPDVRPDPEPPDIRPARPDVRPLLREASGLCALYPSFSLPLLKDAPLL